MVANFNDIADRLWNAADKLRANTPLRASEYSVPVLGLIFLKFADQRFEAAERILQERATSERSLPFESNALQGGGRALP